MRLTFFGHSCFLIEIDAVSDVASAKPGVRLVLDPYLKDNPHGRVDPARVPCDYVLCTHAHEDHIADALNLSRLHGATIVAPYELAEYFAEQGAAKALDLMPGGGVNLPWGRIQMTPAIHSSALELPGGESKFMGAPCGYLITAGGQSLYHAGDTALFGDMKFIGRGGLDVALLPIGDRYTMGSADAVEALNLLRPKLAVPMHYDTQEKIRQNPHAFAKSALAAGHTVRVMGAGETIEV
ncbi:MAG: metal-dependent hydrolase [Opitutus sp.]|nr:metal-dependent hydrolase [Opitutus sp.]